MRKTTILTILSLTFLLFLSSCEKDDEAITLPPPGDLQNAEAAMGINYDNQVYFSFGSGQSVTKPYRIYDLAFEASADGYRVYLNTAKYMFAKKTSSTDITTADSSGGLWKTDPDNLEDDSLAFGNWKTSTSADHSIVIIDRGKYDYTGADRFRKLQLIVVDPSHYEIKFCNLDNSNLTSYSITKDPLYALMYFRFDNNGELLSVAPPKAQWDIVFTKYTHTYYDQPLNSPYRYYTVTGGLLNIWNNESTAMLKKDSLPNYKAFSGFVYDDVGHYSFTTAADQVGFDWKYYDFNSSAYIIRPDQYYLLLSGEGLYYKIRFLDFYDAQGNKGTATFEYQRL